MQNAHVLERCWNSTFYKYKFIYNKFRTPDTSHNTWFA